MIRRPPRSTLDRSSAASDVYKRQSLNHVCHDLNFSVVNGDVRVESIIKPLLKNADLVFPLAAYVGAPICNKDPVSYTHLRAHETVLDLVCRLLLEKNK